MRYFYLVVLAACSSGRPVVMWTSARGAGEERIEVRDDGNIRYTAINGGVAENPESLRLTTEQVHELGELLRSHRACELAHEPGYTPGPDEGQTTLVIAFPDQQCKVTLWNSEWQRGRARDISETMRSMRPRPR